MPARSRRKIRTGNVHLNGAPVDFTVPFGGYKQSGHGREWGGEFGMHEYLEIKADRRLRGRIADASYALSHRRPVIMRDACAVSRD